MSFNIVESGLPATIYIGPFPHNVVFKEGPDFGTYTWNDSEIAFRPQQASKEFAVDTVLHEVMHGIWRIGNLATNKKEKEEKAVAVLATGLLQVLRDNPLLVAWLLRQIGT